MVTLSEVSTGPMGTGYITLKWVNAVSQTHSQTDTNTATTRMSDLRLTIEDLAIAREKVIIWLEFTEEAVTDSIVLSHLNAAR